MDGNDDGVTSVTASECKLRTESEAIASECESKPVVTEARTSARGVFGILVVAMVLSLAGKDAGPTEAAAA